MVSNIGDLVRRARTGGVPVVWVQQGDDDLIAELNVGLNWVSFPGVTNRVSPSADIRFDAGAASVSPVPDASPHK